MTHIPYYDEECGRPGFFFYLINMDSQWCSFPAKKSARNNNIYNNEVRSTEFKIEVIYYTSKILFFLEIK